MRYHLLERCSLVNGPGARAILWVQGCPHNCAGCQNPDTHDVCGGKEFDAAAEELLFSYFGEKFCSGITFSGGDPLMKENRDTIGRLVKKCRELHPEKSIWLYTGSTWDAVLEMGLDWLSLVDVVVEGPFVLAQRNVDREYCGSDNQNIVDVVNSLEAGELIPYCP